MLPAKSERALNKFLTEYDRDENQLNKERLELLQQTDDTRWSSEGVVIINDTFTHKTGENIPDAGKFYNHTIHSYIWGQNLIYALYADEKPPIHSAFASTRKTTNDASNPLLTSLTNSSRQESRRTPISSTCSTAPKSSSCTSEATGKSDSQLSRATRASPTAVSVSVSTRPASASTRCVPIYGTGQVPVTREAEIVLEGKRILMEI
jgi:hypothetical protein